MSIDLNYIPEYENWKDLNPDDPRFMLYYKMSIAGFASSIEIIDPDVDIVNDLYVLRLGILRYDDYLSYENSGLSYSEIESRINRFRIKDLFQYDSTIEQAGEQILSWIADQILKYWKFNLDLRYPDVKFVVKVINEEFDPEIMLFVER